MTRDVFDAIAQAVVWAIALAWVAFFWVNAGVNAAIAMLTPLLCGVYFGCRYGRRSRPGDE